MDRLHRLSGFSFSRRSTPGSATNSHGSGASCRGCESRRTTASTPTRGRKPWASSSTAARKLLVYHFMFGPSYQAGCPVNWSMVDSVDGLLPHVHARDATVVFVSQAALKKLQAYRRRMGWTFPWVSAARTDFNFDLGFSQTEEQSRQGGRVDVRRLPANR